MTINGEDGETKSAANARVYLSGPMDFVASREAEKKFGWRNRVSEFLQEFGVTVFDPWFKPEIQGVKEYGREDETTAKVRAQWSFDPSEKGADARASCADQFLARAAHGPAHGGYKRLHRRVRPDQRLQRRHAARDHPLSIAAEARAVRQSTSQVSSARPLAGPFGKKGR